VREEEVEKGCGKVKLVQLLCTHVNRKVILAETIPGMGGGIKENGGWGV
jgi:hypothetical protein